VGQLLAFLGVAVLLIGQDTALTIRNTLACGRRAGIRTAFGVSAGQAIWAFAAAVGLAALLQASEPAFVALRLAGAAYLVHLGAVALGVVFCVLTLAWLSAYAFTVARAGDFLRRSGIRRAIDAVTGAVLVAFGLRLATESR
jgi:threonine/homoserine/homoserine lactone efflux protein